MRLEPSIISPRKHVHLHGLGARLALLALFAVVSMTGIAVGLGLEVKGAIERDMVAATERVMPLTQALLRSGADDAARTEAARTLLLTLPPDAEVGVISPRGTTLVREPNGKLYIGQSLPEKALSTEVLSLRRGTIILTGLDGIERLYSFGPMTDNLHPEAFSYVGIPTGVAFASVKHVTVRAIGLAAALTLLVAWATLTLADALVLHRIRKMVDEMRRIAMGESTDTEQIPGGLGDLDELSNLFSKMRNRMVEATSDTDEKVRSRTADLEFNKGMAEFEQARTEALISSIGEAVIATDREGRIIFINQEVSHAMGWIAADLVGKQEEKAIGIVNEKDEPMPVDKRPARIALLTGQKSVLTPFPKAHSMLRKDGSSYPVQVTVTPVVSGGNIIGAIEVIRDVSAEIELDRRKSEFISIASHQLRAPLAATKWLSDMLRTGDLGKLQPKQQETADKLFEANERMVVLVNELLNVSRLDSGVSKPTPRLVEGSKLLESVLNDSLPLLTAKKQKFAYDKPKLPQIYVDELLIREVLVNLISNASKYSPDGGTVTVTAGEVGGMLQVSIHDEGIGIPKSDQNQLFKKFFRAGNALKSAVQGTGLGLYFVKSIIELSGGKIWLESEEDKGTTFYVTLPLNASQMPTDPKTV